MSNAQQYYVGLDDLAGYGDLYFLKLLQEANCPGGGEKFLGSILPRIKTGFLGWGHGFPVPMFLTAPQTFLQKIPPPVTGATILDQTFATCTQVASMKTSGGTGLNVGPFPSVPATLGVDLDWSKGVEVKCNIGAGSVLRYIPRGYSAALYKSVAGNDKQVDATGIVGDNFVVESVLLANKFDVEFVSTDEFDADFQAKIDAINAVPNIGGKLKINNVTKKSVIAQIDGAISYLVALGVARWSDFDLD